MKKQNKKKLAKETSGVQPSSQEAWRTRPLRTASKEEIQEALQRLDREYGLTHEILACWRSNVQFYQSTNFGTYQSDDMLTTDLIDTEKSDPDAFQRILKYAKELFEDNPLDHYQGRV